MLASLDGWEHEVEVRWRYFTSPHLTSTSSHRKNATPLSSTVDVGGPKSSIPVTKTHGCNLCHLPGYASIARYGNEGRSVNPRVSRMGNAMLKVVSRALLPRMDFGL